MQCREVLGLGLDANCVYIIHFSSPQKKSLYEDDDIMLFLFSGDKEKMQEYKNSMEKRLVFDTRVMIVPPHEADEDEDIDHNESTADGQNYPGLWYHVTCSAMPSGERRR